MCGEVARQSETLAVAGIQRLRSVSMKVCVTLHCSNLLQFGDLGVVVAELSQDFHGVLSENGRRPRHLRVERESMTIAI